MYLSITALSNLKNKSRLFLLIPLLAFAAVALVSWRGGSSWGRSKLAFGFAHELPLTAVGLCLFGYGFSELRKKRLIEDTPTSKVRSAAMGLCELIGFAKPKTPLVSPLSGAACVCYRYKIEEEKRGSKGSRYWATIKEGCSTEYFYIEDETGKMLVDPLNAELVFRQDYQNVTGGMCGPRNRYTEWYLCPGDYVYVLGTVKKFKDAAAERLEELTGRLRALKADTERLMTFDTNKDGQISAEEWDVARQKVEEEMLADELKRPVSDTDDLVIAAGSCAGEKTFIIADRDEQEVAGSLLWKSLFGSVGGGALVLLMFASMLARLGVLSQLPPIPWEMFYH